MASEAIFRGSSGRHGSLTVEPCMSRGHAYQYEVRLGADVICVTTDQAYAHVFAAAPDLHVACNVALALLSEAGVSAGGRLNVIHAALAKANGPPQTTSPEDIDA